MLPRVGCMGWSSVASAVVSVVAYPCTSTKPSSSGTVHFFRKRSDQSKGPDFEAEVTMTSRRRDPFFQTRVVLDGIEARPQLWKSLESR